ncbi:MAG: aldo/keto reductase [Anaerolineae bacterium]|nr:MAG: aldo/keto reductase [Anaerolineae bacterium]
MEYRKLGRTGLEVSPIGLGTEHIEQSDEVRGDVLRTAVEAGVNYVDLLYVEPEYWADFGPVLRPYRNKLVLAAHWGSGPRFDLDYCQRTFDNILSCVGNDYVEVAMMTMVDEEDRWDGWLHESLERLRRYQEQGRVGYVGGSAHDTSMAVKAVKSGLLDVLMFPVNIVGHSDEKNDELYQACADGGVGLVAMKPYHGGTLLSVGGQPSGITPAQCLAYVLSLPVSTAVPGPRNGKELRATLHFLEATEGEKDFRPVVANLYDYLQGQCVYCHHCLPCPEEIQIGWLIWIVDYARHGVTDDLRGWYASHAAKASDCTACGVCLERCPFDVDIVARMREAVEIFESD